MIQAGGGLQEPMLGSMASGSGRRLAPMLTTSFGRLSETSLTLTMKIGITWHYVLQAIIWPLTTHVMLISFTPFVS